MTGLSLVRRVEIAQALFDRFNGAPYALGGNDCVTLARAALVLADRPDPSEGRRYTRTTWPRQLRRLEVSALDEALDLVLPRRPLAAALAADLVFLPSDMRFRGSDVGALGVVIDDRRVLAAASGRFIAGDRNCGLIAWNLDGFAHG